MRYVVALISAFCLLAPLSLRADPIDVRVDRDPAHRIATFVPIETIGSTVDKEPAGSIPSLYSRANVRRMLQSGIGWLSYRLFTELSVQDWHWNDRGSFSAGKAGYWTSDASTGRPPIADSFGYRLPHRGATSDQGNNADYSRLDDGVIGSYWKSNPYLTQAYTGEADSAHPQWVVVDLGRSRPVDAIRIRWSAPYATGYVLQYWTGPNAVDDPANGRWNAFAHGDVSGRGGVELVRVAPLKRGVRFVRILMSASSGTCDSHGARDRRDCVGYAIDEIGVGTLHGRAFRDLVIHATCGGEKPGRYACGERQTATYVSSTDPWHARGARVRDQEQPGLDLIARSGLGRGIPAMYPVPMLYATPENAVAEIRYIKARGYPVAYVELGEEPDGQYVEPEDYAALYVQWARALHAVDPALRLGGPVFSGVNADLQFWADRRGDVSWLHRFLRYLRAHGAERELSFMSFEHYPFEGCEHGAALHADLLRERAIQRTVVTAWRRDGLPRHVPMFVTEANFSAVNFTQTPMQIEGALWLADYMAGFLTEGVRRVVYYQDEPVPLSQNARCVRDWGNLAMFAADTHGRIRATTAQFQALRMMTRYWLGNERAPHQLYRARVTAGGRDVAALNAYAVRRPDRTWSVLLVNDDAVPKRVRVGFAAASAMEGPLARRLRRTVFGPAQYVWRARGAASLPEPNEPPRTSFVGGDDLVTLPGLSLTVLSGVPHFAR